VYLTCQAMGAACRRSAVDSLRFEKEAPNGVLTRARIELSWLQFRGLEPGRGEPIIPCHQVSARRHLTE